MNENYRFNKMWNPPAIHLLSLACAWIAISAFLFISPANAQNVTVELLEHPAPKSLTFGPTSDLMLSGSDGYYQMWDRRNQTFVGPRMLVNSLYTRNPNGTPLKGRLRFSRDGRFMASCRDYTDRDVAERKPMLAQVWDMRTGKTLVELERAAHNAGCMALDFSPDGDTLAVANGSFGDINAVRFFETQNWIELRRTELGRDARLLNQLRYSPDGQQLVVWASNPSVPPGVSPKEYKEETNRIGLDIVQFQDHRIEAIVLNAANGQVLARKVLHWFPTTGNSLDPWDGGGFDASSERILSSAPYGGSLEQPQEAIYANCASYRPRNIPEGFKQTDLCKKHKAVQVWHWRTGQVDTLFEYPLRVRSPYFAPETPETWTKLLAAQFTTDGRHLVWVKEEEDKSDLLRTEVSRISPSVSTLEIRDARTYQLLLSKEIAPKGKSVGPLQVSPDGRYLAWTDRINKRYNMDFTKHFYEILSK